MKINISLSKTISPTTESQCMSFWHGGNLDDTSMRPQKKGRFEYGAGLYLITRYEVATKYAKGSRKLYLVTVEQGTDAHTSTIEFEAATKFVSSYIIKRMQPQVMTYIESNIERVGHLSADSFNAMVLNSAGLQARNTVELSQFLVNQGIDYELINNPFGWGQAVMMVLYNTRKINSVEQVMSKDKILMFDLPTKFNL